MQILMTYGKVFLIGAIVCAIAQLVLIKTKVTPSRILVAFLLAGALLQAVGIFEPIKQFAQSGITSPIIGFGASITKGAIEGVRENGILGAFGGGLKATGIVIGFTVAVSFFAAFIFKPKTEK